MYKKFVSSANIIHFIIGDTLYMSLLFMINKIGPNREPCGTPHAIFWQVEVVPLIETYCLLLFRWLSIQLYAKLLLA